MESEAPKGRHVPAMVAESLIAVVALLLILELYYDLLPLIQLSGTFAGFAQEVRTGILIALVIIIAGIALRIAGRLFERVTVERIGSHAQARSIWRLVATFVWAIVLIVVVLGLLGDVTSTALGVGLIGAALAFILQRPLLNALAWIIISYQRMYRIGDRIAMGPTRGYVTDIRITHTFLREFGEWMHGDTFTGRIVAVPNSLVFDAPVSNYTRDIPIVWDEVENLVTYESDIDVAKEHMLESAKEVVGSFMSSKHKMYLKRLEIRDLEKLMLKEPQLRMEFSDSGVKLQVIYFCPVESRRNIRSDIVERVWRRFSEDSRVEIAYPHMEIVPYGQEPRVPREKLGVRAVARSPLAEDGDKSKDSRE